MQVQKLYRICPQCGGTGIMPITQVNGNQLPVPPPNVTTTTCNHCNGTGYNEWGYVKVQPEEL